MEQNNPEKAILLSTLEQFGDVEIVNDSILNFTDKKEKTTTTLRYSIGEVFSFLKGADPCKIQVKAGHPVNVENFEKKLNEVIKTEKDNEYPVALLYKNTVKLGEIKKRLKGLTVIERPTNISIEISEYTLYISPDRKVTHKFKPSFYKIDTLENVKSIIDTLEVDYNRINTLLNEESS